MAAHSAAAVERRLRSLGAALLRPKSAPEWRLQVSSAEPELAPTDEQLLEEHRYAFELQGFVVVENVLS
eukprot:COSAG06_NODE_35494_length_459_cov_1.230556_1_plen_69_part_00